MLLILLHRHVEVPWLDELPVDESSKRDQKEERPEDDGISDFVPTRLPLLSSGRRTTVNEIRSIQPLHKQVELIDDLVADRRGSDGLQRCLFEQARQTRDPGPIDRPAADDPGCRCQERLFDAVHPERVQSSTLFER